MIARFAGAALTLVAALAVPASAPAHATGLNPAVEQQLGEAYAATARYGYTPFATADGYRARVCLARAQGGMGFHYFNESHFGSLDPTRPGALLYEDAGHGERRLIGVEWVVPVTGKNMKRPRLFGQDFQGPMPGHYPGMPTHYDLHVWLYKQNPNGLFAQWNPRVTCPASAAQGMKDMKGMKGANGSQGMSSMKGTQGTQGTQSTQDSQGMQAMQGMQGMQDASGR
ncbi:MULTISPECIES: hypothetical protein [unclassified Streptomyces]|uniref:hypothetical protein n=1 Tax=unclassified Streptomyces TaxID=2593676 RepID=UPI0036AE65EB